jgi:hypothetical protein
MRAFSASGFLALPALLFAAGLAPLAAQDSARQAGHEHGDKAKQDDPDRAVAGGGSVPTGWTVRTDGGAGNANVKVVPMGQGMHVTLGPAIILYQDKHAGNGPFHTLATFTQTKPSTHPEGYGLFFGGQALNGAGQKYTYFLIRQDGKYLVKRREGDKTTDVTKGWMESAAVKKPAAQGSATNLLEIDAKRNPSKVVFKVNGESVYTMDAKPADVNGTVGLRVNHNLDVHVEGFDVHR